MSPLAGLSGLLRVLVLTATGFLMGNSSALAVQLTSTSFKGVFIKTSQAATTINENNGFALVSDASIANFVVVSGDADLFTVLFTAQVEMKNATSNITTLNEDALLVKIQAVEAGGGVTTLNPTGPIALASADSVASHAVSASARLAPGTYTIRVVGRIRDTAPDLAVSAAVNHWMMTVTRYD